MSAKNAEKIWVACDVDACAAMTDLSRALGDAPVGLKVGLQLLTREGIPTVVRVARELQRPIFLDVKFHDIPNTVAGACRAAAGLGVTLLNVHALGGAAMLRAASDAVRVGADAAGVARPQLLAVTILTSLDAAALRVVGLDAAPLADHVVRLAQLAQEAGCDGVVASPHEIMAIRAACGSDFAIVTPGVRPTWAVANDQVRVMTPRAAIDAGATAVVIGRPITNPPSDIGSPAAALQKILEELA